MDLEKVLVSWSLACVTTIHNMQGHVIQNIYIMVASFNRLIQNNRHVVCLFKGRIINSEIVILFYTREKAKHILVSNLCVHKHAYTCKYGLYECINTDFFHSLFRG